MAVKTLDFGLNPAEKNPLITAYSFRFTETPEFTPKKDCITTCVNPNHREGFDNISLVTTEKYASGVRMTLVSEFEDLGCAEIILVEKLEKCHDGAVRYGACFEVILYKDGINVWRHYRDDGICHWHKRLALHFPVSENQKQHLAVQVANNTLLIEADDLKIELRTEDLPETFHVGLTACEGIVRLYQMTIEE